MRWRLRKFLPIVLMALVMQVLAPIAACWAASIAASDPLAAAIICQDAGGRADGQANQPGRTGHAAHDGACALCCLAYAGTSLDTPTITIAEPYRRSLRVVWHDVAAELRDSRTSGHAQARGPPSIS